MQNAASNLRAVGCDADEIIKTAQNLYVSLGANRVILVRDEEGKTKLRKKKIGKDGLIFTILESKGMEFEYVILWNFFSDSPFLDGLRNLRNIMIEDGTFDPRKYAVCKDPKRSFPVSRSLNE